MEKDGIGVNTRIERIEDTLMSLIEGFARYKAQLIQAYDYAQRLSSRVAFGFLSSEEAASHRDELNHALRDYFRLRDQLDWWLEQARQIIASMLEVERGAASACALISDCDQEKAQAHEFEEPGGLFIELEEVF
ncbi:MAG TPA: hypothetical protein VGC87_07720 [Pyrinomonadaceae bacterium]|jgi:hypothetical protein